MEWLASLLVKTGIAAFGESFFKPYLAHLDSKDKVAADLATKEMALEQRERELATQLDLQDGGNAWERLPRRLVQYSLAIWFTKCVVWDTVLGWGSTPALGGDIAVWSGWIMGVWFGGRSAEKIARILKR